MTHSYVWHDSFIYMTLLIYTCDMTHSYVWHDAFTRVTWLIHICDMTHSHVWYASFMCGTCKSFGLNAGSLNFFLRNNLKIFCHPICNRLYFTLLVSCYYTSSIHGSLFAFAWRIHMSNTTYPCMVCVTEMNALIWICTHTNLYAYACSHMNL